MIIKVIVAIYSVFLIPLLTKYFTQQITQYQQQKQKDKEEKEQINLKYLSPLRLNLVESFVRLDEIYKSCTEGKEKSPLCCIEKSEEVSQKSLSWMIKDGCYLMSSCYLIACLFFSIKQVRDAIPYLKIGTNEDTQLLNLMEEINIAFAGVEGGVFYVIQFSIANDIYLREEQRLMTYREFCQMVQKEENREWWDGLIRFFIRAGKRENLERLELVKNSINTLTTFLDQQIGEGDAIRARFDAEKIKN
ncbi:MAG: hypothetical protein MK111_17180 [Crocosphaera sp.]|uniref:hypothetical protein n=1 Tax=Crocosphaera sp. TaxID=2729996 RepID=UPI002590B678|nr:hypothetical protein [Crocosphaera sp.]MCH2246340.1 hypothetical protein [Crocosphaera sp.]